MGNEDIEKRIEKFNKDSEGFERRAKRFSIGGAALLGIVLIGSSIASGIKEDRLNPLSSQYQRESHELNKFYWAKMDSANKVHNYEIESLRHQLDSSQNELKQKYKIE